MHIMYKNLVVKVAGPVHSHRSVTSLLSNCNVIITPDCTDRKCVLCVLNSFFFLVKVPLE